jgi:ribonuclease HI
MSKNFANIITLEALLTQLQLTHNNWDALIVGDGSGSQWKNPAGWGAVLIDRQTGIREPFWGAMNYGTSTMAEIMPYFHALLWYTSEGPGRKLKATKASNNDNIRIHIVTDNSTVAQCGNSPASRHMHKALWAAIDAFRQDHFVINFHHIRRTEVSMNILADLLSKEARLSITDCYQKVQEKLARQFVGMPSDVTVYDFLI